ncbi:GNAT family N-acetyltransferase [Nocardia sp. NPDC058640]|uniref:GNAT family N-acetyltransferase n=1 Tax=Nocardia sp. NPDC058640 TaxID=3346571 RepID=UPI0036643251
MSTSPIIDVVNSTRIVKNVDDINPAIVQMIEASDANFNYSLEFLQAYGLHPIQPVHDQWYLEIYGRSGKPIAFAPCYAQGDPLQALGLADTELALLSHVWHCSDSRLVASAEISPEVAEIAIGAMRHIAHQAGLRRCGFINVAADSPTANALESIGLIAAPIDTRYWLDLNACGDEEGYLARLDRSARREYRRHQNRARDAGVVVTHRSASADEDLNQLKLFESTMARVGSPGYYSAERLAAFLAEAPSARIIEISSAGTLLAMGIIFADSSRIHAWACGWIRDPGLPFSPYYLIWAETLRLGFQIGVPRLEGGRRNGPFKERYGMAAQPLNAYLTDSRLSTR